MRILLTGVTGQVGGALQQPLGELGAVMPADRSVLDLAAPESIAAALDRLQPDLIVNPAAYTAVDLAEDQRELAFCANAEAPAQMAAWAAKHRVPMLHFSTDYIFDGTGDRPWREDDKPGPLSVYGASKLAGERAIGGTGCRHLVVRTSWVYAAQGKNFLRTIARLAGERNELRVVADQFGAPTSARAIADAVVKILRAKPFESLPSTSGVPNAVNVCAEGETSWHGFARAIVVGLQRRGVELQVERVVPITTRDYPVKAERPRNSRLELRKLANGFGVFMPPWRDALSVELDELARELGKVKVETPQRSLAS